MPGVPGPVGGRDREGGEHAVALRDAVSGRYPKRELCVQYRETDLAFVSRLLEEEGITYWFEHACDGHTLVLSDAPSSFPAMPGGTLPSKVTLRDYDFERPHLDVTASAGSGALEHSDQPSGAVQLPETQRRAAATLERLRFDEEYRNGFLAAPAARRFRPEARTRRGLATGPQTATVVGPPGEESTRTGTAA